MMTFDGLVLESFDYTNPWGTEPGYAEIVIAGNQDLPPDFAQGFAGDVVLERNDETLTLNGFLVSGQTRESGGVRINTPMSVRLVDDRLLWKYGKVNLKANTIDDHKRVIKDDLTWEEIFRVVWSEIVTVYDLDIDTYKDSIEVFEKNVPLNIDWQYKKPNECLQELLDAADCVLCYDNTNYKVVIARRGIAVETFPPQERLVKREPGTDFNYKPDEVVIVGSPTVSEINNIMFKCVLRDVADGIWKFNANVDVLTVATATDPNASKIALFNPLTGGLVENLATNMLGAKGFSTTASVSAGYKSLQNLFQVYMIAESEDADGDKYLPFYGERFEYSDTIVDGNFEARDIEVTVYHTPYNKGAALWPAKATTAITADKVQIDRAKGIIKFDEPMFIYSTSGANGCFTSASITVTFPYEKRVGIYTYPESGWQEAGIIEYVRMSELRLFTDTAGDELNRAALDAIASVQRTMILNANLPDTSDRFTYVGLFHQLLDGTINQVRYWCRNSGSPTDPAAGTQVSVGDFRPSPYMPDYNQLMHGARINRQLKEAKQQTKQIMLARDFLLRGGGISG